MELDSELSERLIYKEAFLAVHSGDVSKLEGLIPKLNNKFDIRFVSTKFCRCGHEMEMIASESNDYRRSALDDAPEIIERGYCCYMTRDINMRLTVSISLMHFACLFGHKHIVKLLMEHGANVCSETSLSGFTPIQIAIHSPKDEHIIVGIMSLLLDNGANPSEPANKGTLLHYAVRNNYRTVVELLLAYKCDIDDEDEDYETALYLAICLKRSHIIEILVKNNADVNKGPTRDPVPLISAVRTGEYEIVNNLLSTPLCNLDINRSHESGSHSRRATAIHHAVYYGSFDLVTLLLKYNADVNCVDSDGNTPLISSLVFANTHILRELIKFGADVNICNNAGYGAIHQASWDGKDTLVDILLEHGCDHDTRTMDGNTPLSLACNGGHTLIALKLMNLGVNVNNVDNDLYTPLHHASMNDCIRICKRLVELGADPNACNKLNITPLWKAVYDSSRSVVKFLIELNVYMSAQSNELEERSHYDKVANREPHTPLRLALDYCDDPYIAAMFIIAGVNLSEEKWLRSTDLKVFNKSPGSAPHVELLRSYTESPVSLKRLCRDEIRRRLATRLADALPLFDLPASLTDYLLIKRDLELCEAGALDLISYKFD